jgi:hypothetical protein
LQITTITFFINFYLESFQPARFGIGLITAQAFHGHWKKNPFLMRRRWTVATPTVRYPTLNRGVFVRNISVQLDGKPLCSMGSQQGKFDTGYDFLRMQLILGGDGQWSNSISYQEYMVRG